MFFPAKTVVILGKTNLTFCLSWCTPLFFMAGGWTEAAAPPARPLLWQRYLGLPRPEAEGHPGQQYNSSTARVPEGLRPERQDLGGCRLRE